MCCVMGYTGHDLSAAKFKEYLLRTVMRGPDDQRVVEGPFGLMGFGRLAIMGLTANCTASGLRRRSSSAGATSSSPTATVRSCCRCTTSTVWTCSATWTPNSH